MRRRVLSFLTLSMAMAWMMTLFMRCRSLTGHLLMSSLNHYERKVYIITQVKNKGRISHKATSCHGNSRVETTMETHRGTC